MIYDKDLEKTNIKKLSDAEKQLIWSSLSLEDKSKPQNNLLSIFNYKKYMVGLLIGLLILGGGGGVVAAANASVPGDSLYGVDLAVEKARIKLANSSEKKDELRVKFANERVSEAEKVAKGSVNVRDIDLSSANVTEVEVDVFTNETTVKIEADNKHYGFVTKETDKEKIISEIKSKYNLTDEKIEAVLDFEVEDRDSRSEDKGFLNSNSSIEIKNKKEKRDFEISLQTLSDWSDAELSDESEMKIKEAIERIREILESNPNSKIKIDGDGFKLEVKENGKIKFESKDDDHDSDDDSREDKDRGHGNDEDRKDDDNPGFSVGTGINVGVGASLGGDTRENDNEVFCRGEWRDPEDCDGNNNSSDDDSDDDDSDDDDDHSGRGRGRGGDDDDDDN
ncbi:MAG: DUF5667 domain-containing protein [Candidatus Paceibacterota bacterium]